MSKLRKRNNAIRSYLEGLEDRINPITTLFLDFGIGFGVGNTIGTTATGFRNIFGSGINGDGTGSDLTASLGAAETLDFQTLNYDYDGNGTVNNADLTALANAVLVIARRAAQPYDLDVQLANAPTYAAAGITVAANAGDTTGQFDAYNFIGVFTSSGLGGGSVGDGLEVVPGHGDGCGCGSCAAAGGYGLQRGTAGDGLGLFGIAAADDLFAQSGNDQDEATLTFADVIFDSTTGTVGTADFNANLAHRIAYTAVHEAAHTLTLIHTDGVSGGERLLTNGDQIRVGSQARETTNVFSRFALALQGGGSKNNHTFLAADADIGLRDDNRNGVADFAYITGTGAHDRITVTAGAGSTVNVNVEAFSDTARTAVIRTSSYSINLLTDTEGGILIDSSVGNDEIIVDGDVAAAVTVRGSDGDDRVVLRGRATRALTSFDFLGEAGDDTLTVDFTTGNPMPTVAGSFRGGLGTNSLIASGNVDFTLSDTRFGGLTLASIAQADLAGGAGDNVFDVGGWTGTGSLTGGGGTDVVFAIKDRNFTLANGGLRATDGMVLSLASIEMATLVGGAAANTFNVTGWTGGGSLNGFGGIDSLTAAKNANFLLADGSLGATDGLALSLASIESAFLTGGSGANTFTVTDWTGGGLLTGAGGADTIVAVKNGDFNLADSSLVTSDGMNLTLASVETANLTGGAGVNTFTVSGWTGGGTLTGAGGTDTVTATKNNNFTLADASLATSDGMNFALVSVEFAVLVGGASVNTFTVSGWTGGGVLNGQGGFDALAVTKDRDFVLADGALFSTDALNLTLTSIETVNLTGGASGNMFDVTAFTGMASINGAGGTDRVSAVKNSNFTLADNALAASDGLALTLASIEFAVLTGGAGDNTFSVGGWTGVASLDGLAGTDTVSAVKDSDFILSNSALTATDGLSLALFSFEAAALGGGAGANTFAIADWTGAAQIVGAGGIDTVRIDGRAIDDVVNVRVADAAGGGSFVGAGMTVGFATVENWNFDGQGGVNSLAWIDDTNTVWGTIAAPDTGIIFRPTGATSGDVRLGGPVGLTVSFDRIGGSFTVNGDGNASGDRDVLTVLGVSTAGLQSAGSWAEMTSGNGTDAIAVSDSAVTIVNSIAGALRGISFSTPTIGTLFVRAGIEGPTGGDTVVATPSVLLNILIDGMDPAGGVGDTIDVRIADRRVEQRLPASGFGPAQIRIVRAVDGAGIGFFNFEHIRRPAQLIATGSTAGAPAEVRVFDALTGELRFAPIRPFDDFAGGVTVATGDITGDGIDDIVVGAGPGAGPRVSLYDGADGHLINTFFAFASGFQGGVTVAAGDINGDGYADMVVGAGPGAGAHVKVFDGFTGLESMSFFAYDSGYKGGVTVAVGDLDGDGLAEVVTGMGSGGIPLVKAFRGSDGAEIYRFLAYDIRFGGGVTVAIGDIDGDGRGEIITGTETNGPAHVKIFRGGDAAELGSFLAFDPRFRGGVSVAARDLDGDGRNEILIGAGTGTPHVKGFRGLVGLEVFSLFSGDPRSPAGVNVG